MGDASDLIFRAIADPTRRAIVAALSAQPLPVHEVAKRFSISRPAVSKHLRILSDAGLVSASRAGKANVYRLHPEALEEVAEWLGGFWSGRLLQLKRLVEGN